MPNIASKSVENIKRAALDAVATTMPSGVYYGTVISVDPLKINVESKMVLEKEQLVLSTLVREFDVEMTVDHLTESADGHVHGYKGKKKFKVHLQLILGEKVILLREQGGQRYIVLDRVREDV